MGVEAVFLPRLFCFSFFDAPLFYPLHFFFFVWPLLKIQRAKKAMWRCVCVFLQTGIGVEGPGAGPQRPVKTLTDQQPRSSPADQRCETESSQTRVGPSQRTPFSGAGDRGLSHPVSGRADIAVAFSCGLEVFASHLELLHTPRARVFLCTPRPLSSLLTLLASLTRAVMAPKAVFGRRLQVRIAGAKALAPAPRVWPRPLLRSALAPAPDAF